MKGCFIAGGLCFGALVLIIWLCTLLPGAAKEMVSETPAAPRKPVTNPVPDWTADGMHVYIPAYIGFRIERADLQQWPLKLAQLDCSNTQYCVYAVDQCTPWEIFGRDDDSLDLMSPDGPHFRAVGPWDMLLSSSAACRKSASKRQSASLFVRSSIDGVPMARPN